MSSHSEANKTLLVCSNPFSDQKLEHGLLQNDSEQLRTAKWHAKSKFSLSLKTEKWKKQNWRLGNSNTC